MGREHAGLWRRPILVLLVAPALAGCDLFRALGGGAGLACDDGKTCPADLRCIAGFCTAQFDASASDGSLLDSGRSDQQLVDQRHSDTATSDRVGRDMTTTDGVPTDGQHADVRQLDNSRSDLLAADTGSGCDGANCPTGYCGDGMRGSLEGCDDHGTSAGDGCSDRCVVEGLLLTPYAELGALNGQHLALTPAGVAYVVSYSPTTVMRVDPDGTITRDVIPSLADYQTCGIQALGEDLLVSGTDWETDAGSNFSYVHRWSRDAGLVQNYREAIWHSYDIASDGITFYLGFYTEGIRRVESRTTSSLYRLDTGSILGLNPHNGRLLTAVGGTVYQDDGAAQMTPLYSLPSGNIGDFTYDAAGDFYATCYTVEMPAPDRHPCTAGAVWAFDAAGGARAPVVDDFALVAQVSYDASTDSLVLLTAGSTSSLFRVPLSQ